MTNLEKLRAAIVKIIGIENEAHPKTCEYCHGEGVYPLRELGIADVLRAIGENEKFSSMFTTVASNGGFYKIGTLQATWNITKNLDEQSPECINFLTSMLCKD